MVGGKTTKNTKASEPHRKKGTHSNSGFHTNQLFENRTCQLPLFGRFFNFYFVAGLLKSLLLNNSNFATSMVTTRKKRLPNKKLLSQLNEFLNDFVIGNNVHAEMTENEAVEMQNSSFVSRFDRSTVGEDTTSHD